MGNHNSITYIHTLTIKVLRTDPVPVHVADSQPAICGLDVWDVFTHSIPVMCNLHHYVIYVHDEYSIEENSNSECNMNNRLCIHRIFSKWDLLVWAHVYTITLLRFEAKQRL